MGINTSTAPFSLTDGAVTAAKLATGAGDSINGTSAGTIPTITIQAAMATSGSVATAVYNDRGYTCPSTGTSTISFNFKIPASFNGKHMKITAIWAPFNTDTGNCYWKAFFIWGKVGGAFDTTSENSGATMLAAGNSVASKIQQDTAKAFTTTATVATGDNVQLKFQRLGTDGADTYNNDAYLISLLIEGV